MDKITQSRKNITPYGGLNFIYQAMNRMGLDKFLDAQIGSRSVFAKYSYSNVVYSLFGNSLTQGSFVADLETLKEKYSKQVFNKIPSPDTVEYVCQELKTDTILFEMDKGVHHQLNYNNQMNETLVALAVKTKQLKAEQTENTLDFDNVITENEKQDAEYTYKHCKGYHPGMAFIGRTPVHIENRNGNTPARYGQKETLQRCVDTLQKYNIKIKNFRADAASYQKEVIELAEINAQFFYIRMMDFEDIRECCGKISNWQTIEINYEKKEVASMLYAPFGGEKHYRIVVTQKKRKDGQIDLLSGSAYTYHGIITNNHGQDEKQVIEFYNQRGDAENS
ncbi:MAG: transposase, partial [Candidatus Binatota bacterium]